MKVIWFIINSIFLTVMIGVAGLFMLPYLPFDHGLELRIVESGSMEPAIMTGSLILVQPSESYQVGDVIMFDSPQARVPTTHRIVEISESNGRTQYITKGDANEEADTGFVGENKVFGAVKLDVPRVGFVLDFARQPIGFMLLIVLPALLIVFSELEKIWREISSRRRSDHTDGTGGAGTNNEIDDGLVTQKINSFRSRQMMDIATPVHYKSLPTLDLRGMTPRHSDAGGRHPSFAQWMTPVSVVVFSVIVFSSGFLGTTVSYLNDTELSKINFLSAIALDVSVISDGSIFEFLGSVPEVGSVEVTVAPEAGSVAAHYEITTNVTAGSTLLCDAIVADAGAPVNYVGTLPLLTASDVTFAAPWNVSFSLPDETGLVGGETCVAEIVLTAWYDEALLGEGYYDEEIVPLVFTYTSPTPVAAAFSTLDTSQPLTVSVQSSIPETNVEEAGSGGSSTQEDSNITEESNDVSDEEVLESNEEVLEKEIIESEEGLVEESEEEKTENVDIEEESGEVEENSEPGELDDEEVEDSGEETPEEVEKENEELIEETESVDEESAEEEEESEEAEQVVEEEVLTEEVVD